MATISAVIVTIDHVAITATCCWRASGIDQVMAVWSSTSMAPIFAGTSQLVSIRRHGDEPLRWWRCAAYDDGVDTAGSLKHDADMPNIEPGG